MIKTLSIQNFKAFDDLQKIQLGSLTLLTALTDVESLRFCKPCYYCRNRYGILPNIH